MTSPSPLVHQHQSHGAPGAVTARPDRGQTAGHRGPNTVKHESVATARTGQIRHTALQQLAVKSEHWRPSRGTQSNVSVTPCYSTAGNATPPLGSPGLVYRGSAGTTDLAGRAVVFGLLQVGLLALRGEGPPDLHDLTDTVRHNCRRHGRTAHQTLTPIKGPSLR